MELTKKYNLIGINFSAIDGSDTVKVATLFNGEFTNGDLIQIPSGVGYDICVWDTDKWINDGGSVETERTVERGTGVWLVLQGATTANPISVTMSGSVDILSSLETNFGQKYVIASPGFPVEISVNSPKFIWENLTDGDLLQIPSGVGYDICVWTDGVWINDGGSVASERVIPQGEAFWVVSQSDAAKVTMDPTK